MNAATVAEMRRMIRLGIDRDHEPDTDRYDDDGAVSVPALLAAAAALFAAWFVVTRPLVAAAFVVGALCIVGFVAVVGFVGWLVFVAGADRREVELPDDEDADRYAGGGW